MKITFWQVHLVLQRIVSRVALFVLYPVCWLWLSCVRRYCIKDIQQIRAKFKTINSYSGPLIICANHLTYIDSLILLVAFGSFSYYMRNFHALAWNFPKTDHMRTNFFMRTICYLGKCVFINSNAKTEDVNLPMEKAKYLLMRGETVMIFPEGTRSKSGRVNDKNFTYGVGRILQDIPYARVLCVYLRGELQKLSSNFPKKRDNFYCRLQVITPSSVYHGLRAVRDLSRIVMQTLIKMEQEYFAYNV